MKNSKRILSVLMALCMLTMTMFSSALCVNAETDPVPDKSGMTGDVTWGLYGTRLEISGQGDMGNYGFSGGPWGTDVTQVIIYKGVTSIGRCAFYGCRNLKNVLMSSYVTCIGDMAFDFCESLENITIPDSVTSIGYNVFIDTAYYKNASNWENGVLYNGNHLIDVDWDDLKDLSINYTVKDGTLTIADNAFRSCSNLKNLTIPNSVRNIGESAFDGCSSLENIKLPNTITSISEKMFLRCSSLKSLTIPDSVTSIGRWACDYCTSLESITIPDKVTSIDYEAFNGCENLKSVIIPDSVTSIEEWAFGACSDDLVFYGKIGSYAEKYAKENNIKFICLHTYKTTTTKASFSKNGKIEKSCEECGEVASTTTIYKASSVKLSSTSYTYNGKVRKPSVTVKNSKGKALKKGTDYTVKYANGCKNVGKYTVKVTLKGNYSGSKTLSFKIIPQATTLKNLTVGKKKITVKWNKKTAQTTGYQLQYSTSAKFKNAKTVTVSNNKTTSKTISNLKGGTKYYVRIRTYKTVNNTKYYSSWSANKSATAKK